MKDEPSIRAARASMDEAKAQSEKAASSGSRLPRRYRLYDKIKDHVSLRTVDAVIVITAVLIVGLLIYGIITGSAR